MIYIDERILWLAILMAIKLFYYNFFSKITLYLSVQLQLVHLMNKQIIRRCCEYLICYALKTFYIFLLPSNTSVSITTNCTVNKKDSSDEMEIDHTLNLMTDARMSWMYRCKKRFFKYVVLGKYSRWIWNMCVMKRIK